MQMPLTDDIQHTTTSDDNPHPVTSQTDGTTEHHAVSADDIDQNPKTSTSPVVQHPVVLTDDHLNQIVSATLAKIEAKQSVWQKFGDHFIQAFLGAGIIAFLVFMLNSINARIDDTNSNINARIDGLNASINARIDDTNSSINARITRLEARITRLEARITRLEARITRLEDRMTELEKEVNLINLKLTALIAHLNATNEVTAAIEGRILSSVDDPGKEPPVETAQSVR